MVDTTATPPHAHHGPGPEIAATTRARRQDLEHASIDEAASNRVIQLAWDQVDAQELAAALRRLPQRLRGRMLSRLRTPTSKLNAVTARLLCTNLNRASSRDRLRAADTIASELSGDLDAMLAIGEIELADGLLAIGADWGNSIVVLSSTAMAVQTPITHLALLIGCLEAGLLTPELEEFARERQALADAHRAESAVKSDVGSGDGALAPEQPEVPLAPVGDAAELEALWAGARTAAAALADQVDVGAVPCADHLGVLARFGRALTAAAQRHNAPATVPSIVAAMASAADEALAGRVRRIVGPANLGADLAALQEAAGHLGEDAGLAERLRWVLEVVEGADASARFDALQALRDAPAPPSPALVDAASVGLLHLEADERPHDAPPASETEVPGGPHEEATARQEPAGGTEGRSAEEQPETPRAGASARAANGRSPALEPPTAPAPAAEEPTAEERAPAGAPAPECPVGAPSAEEAPPGDDGARDDPGQAAPEAPARPRAAAAGKQTAAPGQIATGTADAQVAATGATETGPAATEERALGAPQGAPADAPARSDLGQEQAPEEARTGAAEEASLEEAAPAGEAAGEVLATLVAARRFSLASHLAAALDQEVRAGVLAEAALADAVRDSASPAASEFVEHALSTPLPGDDRGSLTLRVSAAVRVALLDPTSGAGEALRPLIESLPSRGALRSFVLAVLDASNRSFSVLATASGTEREWRRAEAIAAWAAATLERPHHHLLFRATEIWNHLTADDGDFGRILRLVAANDAAGVPEVRRLCRDYATPVRRRTAVDAIDAALLATRSGRRIMGTAAAQLVRNLGEVVEQAQVWCDALPSAPNDEVRESLRAAAVRLRDHFAGELAPESDDRWEQAALTAASSSLQETIGLFSGVQLAGEDLESAVALYGELALVEGLRMDDDLHPQRDVPVDELLVAAGTSLPDAFALRLEAGDLPEAEALIALDGRTQHHLNASSAAHQLKQRELELRRDTAERWREVSGRYDTAVARGRLDDAARAELGGRLAEADPETTGRRDFGRIGEQLDAIVGRIKEATEQRRGAVRADAEDALAGGLDAAWARRIEALVESDELGAAEEYLHRARAGLAPPEDASDDDVDDRLEAVLAAAPEGVTPGLVALVRDGGTRDGLDFSGLPRSTRESIAEALEAYLSMRQHHPENLTERLSPVLRLLGIVLAQIVRPRGAHSTKDYWYVDVHGARSGRAYVPDYGTRAERVRRFMLCWATDLPAAQLWTLARGDAPSDKPVYVLYFGVLSARQRTELARQARTTPGGGVVVIDAAVLLRCALAGKQSFDVTMRAVLPYAAPNPYDPNLLAGMPVEMFYGRSFERASVASPSGTSIISGGRRFGKSALLRAAADDLAEHQDVVVELIVIQDVAAPPREDPGELWPRVANRLAERGVLDARVDTSADGVCAGIRQWLMENPAKRLVLLLDECDFFLRADADTNFANVVRLRDTMGESKGRFKVVFSGLQHVARYQRLPNQPLSQLPQPLVIGPLDAASACDLVRTPLRAVGWSITETQVDRIVTYCACNASVIQLACSELLERLHHLEVETLAPWPVPDGVVDELLQSPQVATGVRDRLFLTLELDHRYKLLAFLLAWRAGTDGLGVAVPPAELRQWASDFWPDGFGSLRTYDVRALCEELVGLGVFAGDAESGYRMLSPGVVKVFGDLDEVNEELVGASEAYVVDRALGAAGNRMRLSELGAHRYSPLTAAQLGDVVGVGQTQLRIVVGSRATRVDAVGQALATTARERLLDTKILEVAHLREWRDAMRAPASGHRIVVSDLTVRGKEESWDASVQAAHRRGTARTARGTRAGVLVAGPSQRWLLRRLVSCPDRAPGDLADLAVPLGRVEPSSLQAWDRIQELDLSLPSRQARLLEVTGGWPILIERVLERRGDVGGLDPALEECRSWLASPQGAATFIAAVGLDPTDPDQEADDGVVATFSRLVETSWQESLPDLAALLQMDEEFVAEDDPAEALSILALIGALSEEDGVVRPETVLGRCWEIRRASAPA